MRKNNKLYCVTYRIGDRKNYKWERTAAMTHKEAMSAIDEIKKGGRIAYLVCYRQSMSIGLPETYNAKDKYMVTE